jgi:hypothetical protein
MAMIVNCEFGMSEEEADIPDFKVLLTLEKV